MNIKYNKKILKLKYYHNIKISITIILIKFKINRIIKIFNFTIIFVYNIVFISIRLRNENKLFFKRDFLFKLYK